mmetsp:Transcript_40592/g.160990  ORF Transcript_40592/g.160990 Transcript_40592/m.160990 type:complete len:102 (-) Transcript_40592:1681-1986(-)
MPPCFLHPVRVMSCNPCTAALGIEAQRKTTLRGGHAKQEQELVSETMSALKTKDDETRKRGSANGYHRHLENIFELGRPRLISHQSEHLSPVGVDGIHPDR